MGSMLIYLFLSGLAAISTSQKFRSDYNYHLAVEGWLKLHMVPATFEDARQRCFLEGTVLASPENTQMKTALNLEIDQSQGVCGIYTGVQSMLSKGYFLSLQGVPLGKMPVQWAQGEPDNAANNENCIAYISNGTVADVNCNATLPFVCYKKKTGNMNLLPCGTVDTGYQYSTQTGKCYKFHDITRSWPEASQACTAEGGYLAIINSKDEANVLKDIIGKFKNRKFEHTFVGFHDWEKRGVFRTVHDETLKEAGYSVWNNGEPNNQGGNEYCGSMNPGTTLNDVDCSRYLNFVCEKDPNSLMD